MKYLLKLNDQTKIIESKIKFNKLDKIKFNDKICIIIDIIYSDSIIELSLKIDKEQDLKFDWN